ncbi:TetR/AcrR family transcriptional regulator [Mycobacterium vicinigordonae]|uniref:TetR/AcrR family transcriptional regulator n=1 Tax=Mycobacterium vicinigordonae TaxID=1719132 RepID=A0A7D6I1M1_9MYCO|nr:TetR/AcrR family transcriptional regulator [Mycobacterium vicinigordonae]QLL08014.1 TetR/AcrR family transcriptional regulator [Mycobacterium vicinigordonae]
MTTDKAASLASARGERRRAKTRASIVAAAEKLLAHTAPESVRIEDVAALAGVSPASVYVHFGTKDGLVAATTEHLLEIATTEIAAVHSNNKRAVDRVIATGRAYLQLLIDHPALTRYLTARALRTDESASPTDVRIDNRFETARVTFQQQIQEAIDDGDVRSLDARLMSHFLFGAWVGLATLSLGGNSYPLAPHDVSRAGLQALEVLTRGASSWSVDAGD